MPTLLFSARRGEAWSRSTQEASVNSCERGSDAGTSIPSAVVNDCKKRKKGPALACPARATVLIYVGRVGAMEARMLDDMEYICRLAADMVIAARKYADEAKIGINTPKAAAVVEARLRALADVLYAGEELYVMQTCFRRQSELTVQRERDGCLREWRDREIYLLVANLIASLVPRAERSARLGHAGPAMGMLLGREFNAMSRALGEAGYLKALAR